MAMWLEVSQRLGNRHLQRTTSGADDEHAGVLHEIVARDCPGARRLLRAHIECSRDVARNLTLHRLVEAA
ncbi:hypothetical protein [Cupriavidus sp. UME77]|uniref:hypothetical protein n=1 Tax=Cupriavidus sp. UME77 TaxID=1862321 RepID=UPI001600BFEC|nr:hypothetical protein [Cupriavidus sp. UME77]MBB1632651.1 hypothetical protein [Cupriavidus sp. UME77]